MATDKTKATPAPEEKKTDPLKPPKLKPGETWYGGNKRVEGPPKEQPEKKDK